MAWSVPTTPLLDTTAPLIGAAQPRDGDTGQALAAVSTGWRGTAGALRPGVAGGVGSALGRGEGLSQPPQERCRQAPDYRGDEAVAPTVYGFDHTLCTSIVTHSLARFCDAVRERCIADELLGPQLRIQLFARDELVMAG